MKVLYLSYDGLTDPLGQSQVLPYLIENSHFEIQYLLMTFDKKDKISLNELVRSLEDRVRKAGIVWKSLRYHKRFSLLATAWDLFRAWVWLFPRYRSFDVIHCRGYVTSMIALALIGKQDAPRFIFDMRGFWPEEKTDGGSWAPRGIVFRIAKYFENKYLAHAHAIIILTHVGKQYMLDHSSQYPTRAQIHVIPTAADMDHFALDIEKKRLRYQKLRNMSPDDWDLRLIYSGSLGTWYKPGEMLLFFTLFKKRFPQSVFWVFTNQPEMESDLRYQLQELGRRCGLKDVNDSLILKSVSYHDLPNCLSEGDLAISFIEPCFSKLSSFPTKFGETLACGLPQIINAGIGDTGDIVTREQLGIVLTQFKETEYQLAIDTIPNLFDQNIYEKCRLAAEKYLDLKKLSSHIREVYHGVTR